MAWSTSRASCSSSATSFTVIVRQLCPLQSQVAEASSESYRMNVCLSSIPSYPSKVVFSSTMLKKSFLSSLYAAYDSAARTVSSSPISPQFQHRVHQNPGDSLRGGTSNYARFDQRQCRPISFAHGFRPSNRLGMAFSRIFRQSSVFLQSHAEREMLKSPRGVIQGNACHLKCREPILGFLV